MMIEVIEEFEDPETPHQRCPICNEVVIDLAPTPPTMTPCKHTLFIATDHGFEFCDDRTKENLNIPKDADPNEYAEKHDERYDGLTSSITIQNSKKITVREDFPYGSEGAYFGFVGDE
jgi:hypothetical protein